MKNLGHIVLAFLALVCMSSCKTVDALYGIVDFKPMEAQEAEAGIHTVVLRSGATMEFSARRSPLPMFEQWSKDVFKAWEKGKDYRTEHIPAGTRVRILAVVHTKQMGYYPFLLAQHTRYLVETPDGRRGTAFIPEAVEGLKVGFHNVPDTCMTISRVRIEPLNGGKDMKFHFRMKEDGKEYTMREADLRVRGQLPVYHDGEMAIISGKTLEQIEGKTLGEVEELIAPTYNISRVNGKLTARFPFVRYEKGGELYSCVDVPLKKREGGYVAEGYELSGKQDFRDIASLAGSISKFQALSYSTSIRSHAVSYGYYSYPRWNSFSSHMMNPTARTIAGMLLGIVLFFAAFLLMVPLLARIVFYIKPLSNAQVKKISSAMFIMIYIFAVIYFGIYSSLVALVLSFLLAKLAHGYLYKYIDIRRCPKCHAVGLVKHTGHTTNYDYRIRENTPRLEKIEEFLGVRKIRERFHYYHQVWHHQSWTDNYVCRKCGHKGHIRTNKTTAETDGFDLSEDLVKKLGLK